MDSDKVESAAARLERNLPIRHNQARLAAPLRLLHQQILRHYLEHGIAPAAGDLGDARDSRAGLERLAAEHIIVLDEAGAITGAYPFVGAARGFRVVTSRGPVEAMCAFDALAVSSMFGVPTLIESRCRLSGQVILIAQDGADIRVVEPSAPVLAAIDWQAAAGASSCSATLCMEMMFIVGAGRAADWCAGGSGREYFDLAEANAIIAAVFVPLMK